MNARNHHCHRTASRWEKWFDVLFKIVSFIICVPMWIMIIGILILGVKNLVDILVDIYAPSMFRWWMGW